MKKRIKQAVLSLLLLVGLLIVVLLLKMALTPSRQLPYPGPLPALPQISDAEQRQMAERLAQAVRIPTISTSNTIPTPESLRALHAHLQAAFPALHQALQRETINEHGLLYVWPGQDKGRKPYLLLAHQDVVPVEPGTESRWTQPPFSGAIDGGYVWGRGAIDDKFSLMGIFEAVERLARAGWKPQRTLYLAFGQDEEVHGLYGARAIAALLEQRGLRLDFVLDEGQAVTEGILPGIKRQVALIGLAEKGYLSAELVVQAKGGHSSMPPKHTAVGILAEAITRLERRPLPAGMRGPTGKLFHTMAPELAFPLKLVMTNLWLLEPLVLYQLGNDPTTNSIVRTTTAVTMIEGSPKDNVLPQRARAVVNFRLYPGDSSEMVLQYIRSAVADPRVTVSAIAASVHEATAESNDKSAAFALIANSIHEVFPDAVIAPSLNGGATDARHFGRVADNLYRFGPLLMRREDLSRVHGTDERVAIADFARGVVFYEQFIRNADKASP